MIQQSLKDEIARVAAAPILLVACDYDGTISAIADSPESARTDERSLGALLKLAGLESTHPAIVSGRAREDLIRRIGEHANLPIIGGHGAEMPSQSPAEPNFAAVERIEIELRHIALEFPGAVIESKPTGVALHYRHVSPDGGSHGRLREHVRAAAVRLGVPLIREGTLVIETSLVATDKGRALRWLTDRYFAHAVVFIGDDLTDEDAFAALRPGDLGVKVGEDHHTRSPTAATARVEDTDAVREVLEALVAAREHTLSTKRFSAIDEHAHLSDQRTCALVDAGGRIVWLCSPRFDAAPVFSQILGGPTGSGAAGGAGFFEIAPADGRPPSRRAYEDDTFILRTEYDAQRQPGFAVTDYLDCSAGRPYQRAGRSDLVRHVAGAQGPDGSGRIIVRFSPRIDFARSPTRVRLSPEGEGLLIDGMIEPAALFVSPVGHLKWSIHDDGPHQTAVATADLAAVPGHALTFELRLGTTSLRPAQIPEPARREATRHFWTAWARPLRLPHLHTELVKRSALVLKSLCYGPTGAICAAGTTSLPEQLGGVRNWDYRFCWIRDAAMSAAALIRLGSIGHALKYLDWLGAILDDLDGPEQLRPLYTIRGQELGPEGEISGLSGYGDSRPVRVGNGAAQQVQLDVFGVVADLIALLAEAGAPLTPDHWRMLDQMIRAVSIRWMEPDHGIWEIRGPMRHHVHSKVMCWHTVARAIAAREAAGESVSAEHRALAAAIKSDILAKGVSSAESGAHSALGTPHSPLTPASPYFSSAYGEPAVDAACLTIGLVGMVAPDDPRFAATVRAVERELREGPTVLRYKCDDGLPGVEGGFHLCTGWLIEALHLVGRKDDARALLDQYATQCGTLGLYAEERCTISGRSLGNYPQAYSHLALINACVRLSAF